MEDGKVIQLPLEEWKIFKQCASAEISKVCDSNLLVFFFCLSRSLELAPENLCLVLKVLRRLIYPDLLNEANEALKTVKVEIQKMGLEKVVEMEEASLEEAEIKDREMKVAEGEIRLLLGGIMLEDVIKKYHTMAVIIARLARLESERSIPKKEDKEKLGK
jgi:hypothetical protein